jgi:hypothetical protein
MRMIAESISSLMSMSTSRTCACTVTSRAVVGSSAMRRSGLQVMAMAIIARWRMPPENSCGYMLARLRASGMPTRSSISTARSKACFLLMPSWMRAISPIWRPTVCTGFSAVSGSWKIMAISLPRTPRRCSSVIVSRSLPFHKISPSATSRVGCRPRIDMAVTDFPEPDSPTMASTSPRATSNDTPSTARTKPSSVEKPARRSRIDSRTSFPVRVADGDEARASSITSASGRVRRAVRHRRTRTRGRSGRWPRPGRTAGGARSTGGPCPGRP